MIEIIGILAAGILVGRIWRSNAWQIGRAHV